MKFYKLDYKLSKAQCEVSNQIINSNKDVIVDAVCGSGKTEICLEVINQYLVNNLKVGFVIPRKEVVKDVGSRLRKLFPSTDVKILHGDSNDEGLGDLTILTAHQCLKFEKCFDLLIIDEVDAYPYCGNFYLESGVSNTRKGRAIYLSATVPDHIITKDKLYLTLNKRFHNRPVPVPVLIATKNFVKSIKQILESRNDFFLIYCPTIKYQNELANILGTDDIINSTTKNTTQILKKLMSGTIKFALTTSTLERGITLEKLSVIVVDAGHELFTESVLIQICGRVNRNMKDDKTEAYLLYQNNYHKIKKVKSQIEEKNVL